MEKTHVPSPLVIPLCVVGAEAQANILLKIMYLIYLKPLLSEWSRGSVQFSHSVVSNSLQSRGLQHTRLLCPSPYPGACSNSWPKYWSFSFSTSPSNKYSGLISFRMDLLAVQGTLKSLIQHHSSKASILRQRYFPHSPLIKHL